MENVVHGRYHGEVCIQRSLFLTQNMMSLVGSLLLALASSFFLFFFFQVEFFFILYCLCIHLFIFGYNFLFLILTWRSIACRKIYTGRDGWTIWSNRTNKQKIESHCISHNQTSKSINWTKQIDKQVGQNERSN